MLPEVGLPKSNGGGSDGHGFTRIERPLDGEEKRGLWVLGGIVGLGLLLGGPRRKQKAARRAQGHDESFGVQGDAIWQQASGAGVVGHGARKD
jgi:hypothetical protein